MSKSENFRDYPKILKIENDGKIIALDKNGKINTDLNIHTIDDDKQRIVFGEVIYNPYSRTEKNYEGYNKQPEDYYNQRDREREWQLQEETKKTKSKNKWLGILLTIAIVVIAFFVIKNFMFNNESENQSDVANEQLEQENQQLQKDINDTKSELKNTQNNANQTQESINQLQSKVDELKANNQDQNAVNEYQNGVDQLQEAQNSKQNGNKEEMQDQLKKVNEVIDTEKISEKGKGQWEKFKSWLNDNISL
ncbi:hypothetical protein [Staphylococcus shinii]|uniref:hypothetical protein n=1 Tax=Staphylococcus shinii TaxID=2912228 RepID=UPI003F547E7D